ncbi:MAG: peroxiredoxin [Parvularcula sp.]|nr:peroxiredoxin [Parvularcula sp.]
MEPQVLTENRGPFACLDEEAPLFEAHSTQGMVRLRDYRGSWVLLFAHPADFTPVCTSEFVALARHQEVFDALGCRLIGLSVDSVYAHLAWFDQIEADFGVRPSFPLLEDPSLAIARAYGMLHDGSSSTAMVRSVFVIDPEGIVRATLTYPMSVGRSVSELLRLVAALQATADGQGVTPEGWKEGEPLLRSAPRTEEESRRRLAEDAHAEAAE